MATEKEIKEVRRRIGDTVKQYVDDLDTDSEKTLFKLSFKNAFDVTVTVDGTETEDYTLNAQSGQITFETAPASDERVLVTYSFAGYNDSEIGELIDEYGQDGAIVELLEELLSNAARLFDYSQGQTSASKSQIFKNLKELLTSQTSKIGAYGAGNGVSLGRRKLNSLNNRNKGSLYGDVSRENIGL